MFTDIELCLRILFMFDWEMTKWGPPVVEYLHIEISIDK